MTTPPEKRQYLEFYRLDLSAATRSTLVPAALLVTVGSGFVCVAAARIPIAAIGVPRENVGLFGASVVLCGLVVGFGGMARLLKHEGFVGVTREGVHIRADGRDEFVLWDDILSVRAQASARAKKERAELVLREGGVVVTLPDVSAPPGLTVSARLEDLRRKASLDLLARREPR